MMSIDDHRTEPLPRPDQKKGRAETCPVFQADDEDEWVSDDPVSCCNCRFRRWTAESFVCVHPAAERQ